MTPPARAFAQELDQLARLLRPLAREDRRIGAALLALRRSLDAWFDDLGVTDEGAPAPGVVGPPAEAPGSGRVGRSTREFRADIRWVPQRAQLKAEACELALAQRRKVRSGEVGPESAEEAALFAQAKALPECYLWALDPKRAEASEKDLEVAAGCYRNLAAVVALAQAEVERRSIEEAPPRRLMSLMAEAQSGVYAMLTRLGIRGDRDQLQGFAWLRERTDHFRIYIPRFMDRTRLAKPEDAPDLARRIEEYRTETATQRNSSEVSSKLRYRLEKATERDDELSEDWWSKVAESMEERAEQGGGEVEPALRALLEQHAEQLRGDGLGLSQSALSWLDAQTS